MNQQEIDRILKVQRWQYLNSLASERDAQAQVQRPWNPDTHKVIQDLVLMRGQREYREK